MQLTGSHLNCTPVLSPIAACQSKLKREIITHQRKLKKQVRTGKKSLDSLKVPTSSLNISVHHGNTTTAPWLTQALGDHEQRKGLWNLRLPQNLSRKGYIQHSRRKRKHFYMDLTIWEFHENSTQDSTNDNSNQKIPPKKIPSTIILPRKFHPRKFYERYFYQENSTQENFTNDNSTQKIPPEKISPM